MPGSPVPVFAGVEVVDGSREEKAAKRHRILVKGEVETECRWVAVIIKLDIDLNDTTWAENIDIAVGG